MNIGCRTLGFVVALVLLHLSLFGLHMAPAVLDPFDRLSNTEVLAAFGALPLRGHALAKYHHALNGPPYAVGVFGNSRTVMLGHQDLDLKAGDMFNFSVGGSSFMQTVALLEELAKAGKAPGVSIISLDNPEMQYFGYSYFPGPLRSVSKITEDARLLYARSDGSSHSIINAIKILINTIHFTLAQTKELWSFDAAKRYFNYLYASGAGTKARTNPPEYKLDGSRWTKPVLVRHNLKFTPEKRLTPMMNNYLENAIIRLSRLVHEYGLNIVVYESPIAPESARVYREAASPFAQATKARMFAMCEKQGLDCRSAIVITAPEGGPYWSDCCHAPAGQLGNYIRTLVNDAGHK